MWINAQAVYKACYNALGMTATDIKGLREFYVEKTMLENKRFRWNKLRSTNLTKAEALHVLAKTSVGDHLRSEIRRIEEEREIIHTTIHFALEATKILEDGTCFVGQRAYNMIKPYLNGQKRIEDDSRSD
jgi:hypothetical protein